MFKAAHTLMWNPCDKNFRTACSIAECNGACLIINHKKKYIHNYHVQYFTDMQFIVHVKPIKISGYCYEKKSYRKQSAPLQWHLTYKDPNLNFRFMVPCISDNNSKQNPTRCTCLKIFLKLFYSLLFCSTCFGHSCAHHQEPLFFLHSQPPVTVLKRF
jgi:hypothetical protein